MTGFYVLNGGIIRTVLVEPPYLLVGYLIAVSISDILNWLCAPAKYQAMPIFLVVKLINVEFASIFVKLNAGVFNH